MLTYLPKGFSVEEEVEEWRQVEGGVRCVGRVTCNRTQSLLKIISRRLTLHVQTHSIDWTEEQVLYVVILQLICTIYCTCML